METRKNRFCQLLAAVAVAALLLPGAAQAAKAKPKLDLNSATQQELEALSGVGEATAKKIIAGRPYSSVADLEKAGVPRSTIDKISKQVTVAKTAKTEKPVKTEKASKAEKPEKAAAASSDPVNLNTASQKELEALPGVGEVTARKIVAGRPYSSVQDLAKAGVSKSTIGKISSLVTAGAAAPAPASKPAAAAKPVSTEEKPVPAAKAAPAESPKTASAPSASQPAKAPPAKGMVWVNTGTKVYHYEGDRWYGNTKEGKYMTEDEAIKAGYRASKEGQKKQ